MAFIMQIQDFKQIIKTEFMPSVKKDKSGRILMYDLIKMLAALLVVFYHFGYYRLDYGFTANVPYVPNAARIIMSFACCGVPLFFFVNGALMLSKKRSWTSVYLKLLKVLIIILIWSWCQFPTWFLVTLCIIYLLFPLIQWLLLNHKKLYFALMIAVLCFPFGYNLFCDFLYCFRPSGIITVFGHDFKPVITGAKTMYSLLYFMLGPVIAGLSKSRRFYLITGSILTVFGWAGNLWEVSVFTNAAQHIYDGVNSSFPTVWALMLMLGIVLLLKCLPQRISPTGFVYKTVSLFGEGILPVFLLHIKIINLFDSMVPEYTLTILTALLGAAAICLVCSMIGWIIKRIPVLCWTLKM